MKYEYHNILSPGLSVKPDLDSENNQFLTVILPIAVALVIVAGGYYIYNKYRNKEQLKPAS